MWTLTLILGGLAAFLFYFYRQRVRKQGLFQCLGIPGPEPHWLTGNLRQIYSNPLTHQQYQAWTKQYGKTYGIYKGPQPVLVTSDLDFLQQVFIRQFNNFHGRELLSIQDDPDEGTAFIHMFMTRGSRWKRLRTIINPTFSSAKLKQLFVMMSQKADILVERLEQVAVGKQAINIQEFLQCLTLDVIGDAAFGLEIDAQRDEHEPFLKHCREVFSQSGDMLSGPIAKLLFALPGLRTLYLPVVNLMFKFMGFTSAFWLTNQLERAVKQRKEENVQRRDLLQLMLDAEAGDSDITDSSMWTMTADEGDHLATSHTNHPEDKLEPAKKNLSTIKRIEKKLTSQELVMQCFLFLVAGYETTSTTLTYTSYLLATNPDKQRKLQQEIDDHIADGEEPSYEKILRIPYLDWVISETLRMYPVVGLVVNRECMEACTVNGINIPKGMTIQADVFTVHYDADTWGPTDPLLFEPERFSPENKAGRHPLAWLPFGAGPRNCVGLRFGLLEAKIALVKVLKKFSLERSDLTQVPLQLMEAGVIVPKDGVYIKVIQREL